MSEPVALEIVDGNPTAGPCRGCGRTDGDFRSGWCFTCATMADPTLTTEEALAEVARYDGTPTVVMATIPYEGEPT